MHALENACLSKTRSIDPIQICIVHHYIRVKLLMIFSLLVSQGDTVICLVINYNKVKQSVTLMYEHFTLVATV